MLGYTLVNQRAEQVNKAVLELCDCLILHRQKGSHSLQALDKWLATAGADKLAKKLPMLEQGECYVWANGQEQPTCTKIPEKLTFHPNRRAHTEPGKPVPVPHMLAGLDLTRKKDHTKTAVRVIKEVMEAEAPVPEPEIVHVPVFEDGEIAKLDLFGRNFREMMLSGAEMLQQVENALRKADELTRRADKPVVRPPAPRETDGKPNILAKGPRTILAVLAARNPKRVTATQCGTMAGFSPSTMRTYLPILRQGGMIDENLDGMTLTEAGARIVGRDFPKLPTDGPGLLAFWKTKLTQGEGTILQALYDAAKRGKPYVDADDLANLTGFTSSTLRTYIPVLRRNNLVEKDTLKISSEFLQ